MQLPDKAHLPRALEVWEKASLMIFNQDKKAMYSPAS